MLDYKGKTILITGASRGIGACAADLFERQNANLILTGTNKSVVDSLNKKYNYSKRKYIVLDLKSNQSITNFLENLNQYEKIDVLINNAGINILDNFVDVNMNDFNEILSVNLNGAFQISQLCAKKMIKNRFGRIINICSIWSKVTRNKRIAYTISKNALHGMTQTMSVELAPKNILVNSVSPGFTLTELTKNTNTEKELDKIKTKIPIKRMANPEEIVNVIMFLASSKNSYMTGQNIVIDGGYTIV